MTEAMIERVDRFRAYLAGEWERWVSEYPEYATFVGHPGFNDRWVDDSTAGVALRLQHLHSSLEALRALDADRLPASEQFNYDLYRELLETAEVGVRFGDDPFPFRYIPRNLWMPLNQLEGVHLEPSDILAMQPHTTVADFERILARLTALPALVEQNIALLEVGRGKGHTPPRVSLQGVPDQVSRLLTDDPKSSELLRTLREFPPTIGESERSRLRREAEQIFSERLVPAYHRLHEYLTSTYLPSCRDTIATSARPDGEDAYAALVRWHTSGSRSPKEIHGVGLAEVRRIRDEMDAVIRAGGFTGTFPEFLRFLRTDSQFYYRSAEDLIDGYRVIAKKIDPELARLFRRLPRLPYGILPMPEFKSPQSPTAYYQPGSLAASRPGYFFANTYDLNARPRWAMEALALHEAVPGHHLQFAVSQEIENVPEFRLHVVYTAYVEGWGLYAESLGEELGCYRDHFSKFGQLSADVWRSARLVVDTGMHALGWSRERAIEFLRENTAETEQDIVVEIDRYIVWPGQALGYKMGQLKIRELRTRAERELGERFDVRAFHDLVLANGALPLGVLEREVNDWIKSSATTSAPT